MKAAVYSKDSIAGVNVVSIPSPSLAGPVYSHENINLFRKIVFFAWALVYLMGTLCMQVLRKIFAWIPKPYGECSRDWVLVEVKFGGVNPVDAKFLYGDKLYEWCLPFVKWFVEGRVCGIDFSGIVVDAPANCGFKVGDEVFGTIPPFTGGFAERVLAPTDQIALIPRGFSLKQAAVLPLVGLTTLQALEDFDVKPKSRILVLGASGGTGHFAVQMGKIKGCHVTGVCSSKNKEFVKSLGADEIILYDACNIGESLAYCDSFDFVFDSVSSHDPRDAVYNYQQLIKDARLLKTTGTYVFIGSFFPNWVRAHLKRHLGLDFFENRHYLFWVRFPNSSSYLNKLKKYCEDGKLKVTIDKTFPFTDVGVQGAFEAQMNRRTIGKIVIDFSLNN